MGKKEFNPQEHGYMPLPPVDEDGELVLPFAPDQQVDLRPKKAAATPEVMPVASDEAEAVAATEPEAAPAEADAAESVALATIESGASESLGTKLASVGTATKARVAAATDKIRQNPAAAIASLAGLAVIVILIILTFIWIRPAGETVDPSQIANGESSEPAPEENIVAESPVAIADLICRADKTSESLYGFKGFAGLSLERRVTFTSENIPDQLAVTNIYTFSQPFALLDDLNAKTTEYKKRFDQLYPADARGFKAVWQSSKSAGIQLALSTNLMNEKLTDAQLLQFGLAPDQNADGTLSANYSREEIERRWVADGFRCSETVAQK